MKGEKYKYFQFPLCLLQQTFANPEKGLNMIANYGIVNFALKQTINIDDVARQLMYAYYRKKELLPNSLLKKMQGYINDGSVELDEDYSGFNGKEFNPEQEMEELTKIFRKDSAFKDEALLFWQLKTAADFLNIKLGSMDATIRQHTEGEKIKNQFELIYGSDAMPYIKPSMLFEFRDSGKDLDLFRAYIGIKSMIGRRNFISTNKPAILSRMIGCKNKAAFQNLKNEKYIKPIVEKYSKRYHMDKLLLSLAERKLIMFLSKEKVSIIYLSTYMEPEDLGKLIRETKEKLNIKKRIRDVTASL